MGRDGTGRVHPLQERLPPNTVSTEETQQSPMLPNTEMVELSSGCGINENSNVLPIQSKSAQLKTSKPYQRPESLRQYIINSDLINTCSYRQCYLEADVDKDLPIS